MAKYFPIGRRRHLLRGFSWNVRFYCCHYQCGEGGQVVGVVWGLEVVGRGVGVTFKSSMNKFSTVDSPASITHCGASQPSPFPSLSRTSSPFLHSVAHRLSASHTIANRPTSCRTPSNIKLNVFLCKGQPPSPPFID